MNKNVLLVVFLSLLALLMYMINQKENHKSNAQPPWMNSSWDIPTNPMPKEELPKVDPPKNEKIEKPTSYKVALDIAKKTNKNVLLVFTSNNCYYCHQLQNNTLSNKMVQEKMSEYITYIVNTDSSSERELVYKYKVSGIPAYFVVSPTEQIISKGSGYRSPGEFIAWFGGFEK